MTAIIFFHLATVLPAAALGAALFAMRKGTARHKAVGKCYVALLATTAVAAAFIPAEVGAQVFWHFGGLHLLVPITLLTLWRAIWAARRGHTRAHRHAMIALYLGSIVVAGGFAVFVPGRLLNVWLFG